MYDDSFKLMYDGIVSVMNISCPWLTSGFHILYIVIGTADSMSIVICFDMLALDFKAFIAIVVTVTVNVLEYITDKLNALCMRHSLCRKIMMDNTVRVSVTGRSIYVGLGQ